MRSPIVPHPGFARLFVVAGLAALPSCLGADAAGAELPAARDLIERHCAGCHNDVDREAGLDLTSLALDPADAKNRAVWALVHDRVAAGEMPPAKRKRPEPAELEAFLRTIAAPVIAAERGQAAREGRTTQRRLNRYEYENTLRDLLGAPWLEVKEKLPEDGEAHRFNKIGDALDVSHVQMARYLAAAEYALRQVIAAQVEPPGMRTQRFYAREDPNLVAKIRQSQSQRPERAVFPALGTQPQPEVRRGLQPVTVGASDPTTRELEAAGVVSSSYQPMIVTFRNFKAPITARYRIRINAYSVWVGPGKPGPREHRWWIPDFDDISPGRRSEPITIYAESPMNEVRWLGTFDAGTEPTVGELEVWLHKDEKIRVDAARFFRSRRSYRNPLATEEGMPGVAFRWLEVDGPLIEQWPSAGHRLLFGDLPLRPATDRKGRATVDIVSTNPRADADRLLRAFVARAYRAPADPEEALLFLPVVEEAVQAGRSFADAMIAGYTAVLSSPRFLYLEERPGRLDDHALAARLSYFLWNSEPDAALRALANQGRLRESPVLRAQVDRLLDAPQSRRFVEAFLDYWLDLRLLHESAPDSALYGDYNLDDLLTESAREETRQFFAELLARDLPARSVVTADFAFVNERLARHYGLPHFEGVQLRRIPLPPDSPRGGLLTQASVLKVTANGTTTSPILRGVWVMERILGDPPRPPPPSVPAVEPDTRGAHTIRDQLAKHRSDPSCAACHVKIDPPGFALESFDVMGAWRDRYRALRDDAPPVAGFGHDGLAFAFHYAQPVDAQGEMPDGRAFRDIREFKRLLLEDEAQLARNLARQLVVYGTAAPVRFSDREAVEKILQRARARDYGVRTLIHEIVQSELFQHK